MCPFCTGLLKHKGKKQHGDVIESQALLFTISRCMVTSMCVRGLLIYVTMNILSSCMRISLLSIEGGSIKCGDGSVATGRRPLVPPEGEAWSD